MEGRERKRESYVIVCGERDSTIIRKGQANPFKLTYQQTPKIFRQRERGERGD